MKLYILGYHTIEYLETISCYLNQCGIYCNVRQVAIGAYTINIDDYLQTPFEIDCVCEELDPSNVIEKTEKFDESFKNASYVINISHIKWFSEFRYNVDENWNGIEQWVSWDIYQKTIRSIFSSAKFGWVFFGAEKVSICNHFFQEQENEVALRLSLQPVFNVDVPSLIQRFLLDIGEERFLKSINNSYDIAGFMFSLFPDVDEICISEKANIYWTLYSFLQSSGPNSEKIYHSLFTVDEENVP